jgi:hypothetical protein
MNGKKIRVRECNDSECANEKSGLQWGVKIMATYKATKLCAHQPVPWKRTNVERGAEESFLPDGQRHFIVGHWGGNASTAALIRHRSRG